MDEASEGSKKFEGLPTEMLYQPPSDSDKEDFQMTRDEFDQLKHALKNDKFRSMLNEYAEEVQDPKSRKIYQAEMKELEKQNGNVVHFINPIPGFVLKTSVNGEKKAFINICTNPMIQKLSFQKAVQDDTSGTMCSIPYAQSPVREDLDKVGRYCDVYDVVFHPNTLALCKVDQRIRQQVETVALEAVENSFNVKLDKNNVRKPNLRYKGLKHATVIKYKIGSEPPSVLDPEQLQNETPPQPQESCYTRKSELKQPTDTRKQKNKTETHKELVEQKKDIEWTTPKYNLKYRSHVDLQDFCLDNQRDGRARKPIPEEIILTVDLPLIQDSSALDADVLEGGWDFELTATRKAHYRLQLKLPFQVHCDQSKASFDVDKRKLVVVMTTVQKSVPRILHAQSDNILGEHEGNQVPTEDDHDVNQNVKEYGFHEAKIMGDLCNISEVSDCKHGSGDSGIGVLESQEPEAPQCVPEFINGDVVVKSILKRSARSRSLSESWIDDRLSSFEDEFMSLENLNEDDEEAHESSSNEKCVRFKEGVQQQLFRSNASILGQRKKNQRKNKNKRKVRTRLSSEGSVSSMDEEDMIAFSKPCFDSKLNEYSATHVDCDNIQDSKGEE